MVGRVAKMKKGVWLSASGLDKEDKNRCISTLLYCLGEDAEDVLVSTHISNDDQKVYDREIRWIL